MIFQWYEPFTSDTLSNGHVKHYSFISPSRSTFPYDANPPVVCLDITWKRAGISRMLGKVAILVWALHTASSSARSRLHRVLDPGLVNEFEMTNRGLGIATTLRPGPGNDFDLDLQCEEGKGGRAICMALSPAVFGYAWQRANRITFLPSSPHTPSHALDTSPSQPSSIYIPKTISIGESTRLGVQLSHRYKFRVANRSGWRQLPNDNSNSTTYSRHLWADSTESFNTGGSDKFLEQIIIPMGRTIEALESRFSRQIRAIFRIKLGLKENYNAGIPWNPRTRLVPWATVHHEYKWNARDFGAPREYRPKDEPCLLELTYVVDEKSSNDQEVSRGLLKH